MQLSIIEQARNQALHSMTQTGSYDPDCERCQRTFGLAQNPHDVFAPRHTASPRCQSGRRAHCTCDTCF